jgi:hypothetical protein
MRREKRRSKVPSSASSSSAGRVPLVMAFLSCLAWLYVAGRYARAVPSPPQIYHRLKSYDLSSIRFPGYGRTRRPGRSSPASSKKTPAMCGSLVPLSAHPSFFLDSS